MADGSLSQEDIDALLGGGSLGGGDFGGGGCNKGAHASAKQNIACCNRHHE